MAIKMQIAVQLKAKNAASSYHSQKALVGWEGRGATIRAVAGGLVWHSLPTI